MKHNKAVLKLSIKAAEIIIEIKISIQEVSFTKANFLYLKTIIKPTILINPVGINKISI